MTEEGPTLSLASAPGPILVLGHDQSDGETQEVPFVVSRLAQRHPEALALIARSLIAEGRRFGNTEEGRQLARQIVRSDAFEQVRAAWEKIAASLPDGHDPSIEPTDVVEAQLRDPEFRQAVAMRALTFDEP